jgi:hypothetical protein
MKKLLFLFLLAMSFAVSSMAAEIKNEKSSQPSNKSNSTCLEATSSCGTQIVACCSTCSVGDLIILIWIGDNISCSRVEQP